MIIVAISDTHTKHHEVDVPDGDVLIHAGDSTNIGRINELEDFAVWFGTLPHKHKIAICGNHEVNINGRTDIFKSIMEPFGVVVLHQESIVIEGVKFYGEPRTPSFYNWGWMYERGKEAKKIWKSIPDDADVIISHGPPYGFGDRCPDFESNRFRHPEEPRIYHHVGCKDLMKRLMEVRPMLHICGHIHEAYGFHETPWGTTIINASTCNGKYQPVNPPISIKLEV